MAKTKNAPVSEATGTEPELALASPDVAETPLPSPEPAPASEHAPAPEPGPVSASDPAYRQRAEFAEVAALATQAARLGVTIDAADAMRQGISANALRRSVLDTLASRAEATSVIAAAPSAPAAGESPIVRRAKERAASART
jgi:hypothetical protein